MSLTEDALKYIRSLEGVSDVTTPGERYPSAVVAVPEKSRLASLEEFQALPNRIKHTAVLVSSAAFSAYVNRFKGPESSIYLDIFGDEDEAQPVFAAVLDHHGAQPAWNSHVAVFKPKLSLEWVAWTELHKNGPITQAELLAFFEDHANDLATPSPAQMLTALSKFEQVEKHRYESGVNLDNGNVQLVFVKEGNQRKVEFPHAIQLAIPVLENEEPRLLEGRIRFRTLEGSVRFTFQFKQDPERVRRDALRQLSKDIKGECQNVHFYEGVVAGGVGHRRR